MVDASMYAWLSLEALRIWLEHGWGRTLIGLAGGAAFAAVALRGDHAAGYRAVRRALALGEARGYEPETSQARFRFATLACWFEPIENAGHEAQQARAELIAGGDLTNAGYAYLPRRDLLLDCTPSLAQLRRRGGGGGRPSPRCTGAEQIGQWFNSYRWLAGVLRGENSAAERVDGVLTDPSINPLTLFIVHGTRAIAAAIFGDQVALARHTAAAMPLQTFAAGLYPLRPGPAAARIGPRWAGPRRPW